MNLEEIVNKISFLEKKYKLYEIKYKSYEVWPFFRMYFYYDYMKKFNIFDISHDKIKININFILAFIKTLFFLNVFKLFGKKKRYIILEHPRNKNGKDIYTENIKEVIGDNGLYVSFSTLFKNNRKATIYLDGVKVLSKVLSKVLFRFVDKNKFMMYEKFSNEIGYSNINNFKKYYIEYILMFNFYRILLKYHNPKLVILVVSYYNLPLVAAAKYLNIKTLEIQHGVISSYHLGYNHIVNENNFFPEYLGVFSNFWENVCIYPKNTKFIEIGNDFLAIDSKVVKKDEKMVLFISQGVISQYLINFIKFNQNIFLDYEIYFKLHPGEFEMSDDKYKELITLSNVINLKIIKNEISLEELQNKALIQVGVFSTALYEGIERRCKTIVLDAPGYEYMKDLADRNIIRFISYKKNLSKKEFLKILDSIESSEIKFFNLFDKSKFVNFLKVVDNE